MSALADRIKVGARVLDLGTGSGALGKFLTYFKGCTVDGVNYNAVEASLAEPYYRRVLVADLEQCDLASMFASERYDYIVCADVLEHIRTPERVAQAGHGLLAKNGRLLLSVPNTGYVGLIAELIAGEFRYREEGLLDATHVRHFTRQTLLRFLDENGWAVQAVEPVTRDLTSSEFRVEFDSMPPAVARYLLAQPDAATYQFVVEARPAAEVEPDDLNDFVAAPVAQALFSAQLFTRIDGRFAEDRKVLAAGVIGNERQTLVFALPPQQDGMGAADGLRLDPADRAGYLQLHAMRLLGPNDIELWQWDCRRDAVDPFLSMPSQQMALQAPGPWSRSVLALLEGDDPWIELPVPATLIARAQGGHLEVDVGWPMSADYIVLAELAHDLTAQLAESRGRAAQLQVALDASRDRLPALLTQARGDAAQLQAASDASRDSLAAQLAQARGHLAELDELKRHAAQLQAMVDTNEARQPTPDAAERRSARSAALAVKRRAKLALLASRIAQGEQAIASLMHQLEALRQQLDDATTRAELAQRQRLVTQLRLLSQTRTVQQLQQELDIARPQVQALDQRHRQLRAQQLVITREHRAAASAIRTMAATRAQLANLKLQNQDVREQKQVLLDRCFRLTRDRDLAVRHRDTAVRERDTAVRERAAVIAERDTAARDRDSALAHITWIKNSTVFRATRPIVGAKMALDRAVARPRRWLDTGAATANANPPAPAQPQAEPLQSNGQGDEPAQSQTLLARSNCIDVIVPVYRGLADTRLCIESALASQCRTPWRLIVLDDASPEPAVSAWLREIAAQDARIVLLVNEENLGFVGTVNRGMALSEHNDVLLLNSDTEVAGDWLDRLRAAAYSGPRVASVTPFSNNATICSYPRFCQDNRLPEGFDTARLDALFARTNPGQSVEVPTGIGFCMYVRRDCLDAVGLFDVENYGKGYGEENDFCQRAIHAGWHNLHALDVFVMHSGGVSFGESKTPREAQAMATLRRMHPTYETQVHRFLAIDPAAGARLAVDVDRYTESARPAVLAVLHDRGGGTVRHVRELAEHQRARAQFFILRPAAGGQVLLESADSKEAFSLSFDLTQGCDDLVFALRSLRVRLIHYHHLIGHTEIVLDLPNRLGVPYDFTAHDFYTVCPQITFTFSDASNSYCGELGNQQCGECLQRSPAPGGLDIEAWRHKYRMFLRSARYVLAPSRDAINHLARYVPMANLHAVSHTDLAADAVLPAPQPQPLGPTASLKIAVIGALSPIKGADVLEDVAALAAQRNTAVEFHLIGFAYRSLRTEPKTRLVVHGEYQESELGALLDSIKPDVIWFPALWPETYSYTLSACLQTGLPVVAPELGAFTERLAGRNWTWLVPWQQTPVQWLEFFDDVRARCFASATPPRRAFRIEPLPISDRGIEHSDWSYEAHYLSGLAPLDAVGHRFNTGQPQQTWQAQLEPTFISAHLPGGGAAASSGLQAAVGAPGVKGRVLHVALRLRASPALSPVTRRIPLRWQTRFKSWLRA